MKIKPQGGDRRLHNSTYKVVALTWGVEEDAGGVEEEDCTEDRRRGEPIDSGGVVTSATVSSRLLGPCGT